MQQSKFSRSSLCKERSELLIHLCQTKNTDSLPITDKNQTKAMAIYVLTLSEEKKHNCSECKKSFDRADYLKRHVVTHSRDKNFTCVQCKRSFGQAGHLKRHMLTHSGVKTHTCSEVFWCSREIEDAHDHPHWGESTQMRRMWRFI